MLKVIPIGFAVFISVVLALGALPLQSQPAFALAELGRTLIEVGAQLGEILQLPVTVPLYLTTHAEAFTATQRAAVQDPTLWFGALLLWSALGLALAAFRPKRPEA